METSSNRFTNIDAYRLEANLLIHSFLNLQAHYYNDYVDGKPVQLASPVSWTSGHQISIPAYYIHQTTSLIK